MCHFPINLLEQYKLVSKLGENSWVKIMIYETMGVTKQALALLVTREEGMDLVCKRGS